MTTERGNTRRANRLSRSRSPYLLQHQYNPVDWHEWGEEAFARAVAEDKPIFLSIGYATCHWCHVMEHESFEDDEVAALLNEHFIAIKVDREERPDIDHVYMAVCQMLSPQCGWPLTVLMTPDRRPFYVATYLPRHGFGGRPGMMELVSAAAAYWRDRREELLENAGQIVAQLQLQNAAPSAGEIGRREIDAAWRDLHESYDHINGGFGRRPKFPAPHNLLFLLRHAAAFDTHPGREMVAETLRSMRRGGIYDQIGFGLHRYSTDERWFLPHFEKMLYDQAMLTLAAAESYRVTGAAEFARMARETITYVLRDLADPIGGFHSAEDADSEGEEGKFYVWRQEEIVEALGAADAAVWCRIHGITREGTYREEASGRLTGANIPYLSQPLAEVAAELGMTEGELEGRLESMRVVLYERRENRRRPGRDDKVLTDWNGLMIAALARAGGVLREPAWIAAAERAADFILETMRDSGGRLLHRWRAGEAGIEGFADDYAFVAWGMLELYRATLELRWLSAALEFASQLFELFHDEESGGLWFTPAGGEQLPVRTRTLHDGAIPSANAVAADVCLRLARLTGEPVWESRARGIGRACADLARRAPGACTHLLASLMPLESESIEVVIVGRVGGADTETLRTVVEESKHPFVNLLFKPADAGGDEIERIAPFTRSLSMQRGGATAYVCRNNTCGLPIKEPGILLSAIGK